MGNSDKRKSYERLDGKSDGRIICYQTIIGASVSLKGE